MYLALRYHGLGSDGCLLILLVEAHVLAIHTSIILPADILIQNVASPTNKTTADMQYWTITNITQ